MGRGSPSGENRLLLFCTALVLRERTKGKAKEQRAGGRNQRVVRQTYCVSQNKALVLQEEELTSIPSCPERLFGLAFAKFHSRSESIRRGWVEDTKKRSSCESFAVSATAMGNMDVGWRARRSLQGDTTETHTPNSSSLGLRRSFWV